jgi:hypothetical protein
VDRGSGRRRQSVLENLRLLKGQFKIIGFPENGLGECSGAISKKKESAEFQSDGFIDPELSGLFSMAASLPE